MLTTLKLKNFVVVEEAEVDLGPGLTVLTGETGAGKSIVIDALGLVLGGRADPDVIRAGADEAVVEALLTPVESLRARLEELGLDDGGDAVVIRRTVHRSGRSRVHVNGSAASVAMLARITRGLVDVMGQHEHLRLLDATEHLDLVDRAGGHLELVEAYRVAHRQLLDLDRELEGLGGDAGAVAARVALIRHGLEELEQAGPVAGEEPALDEERRRLASAERLRHLVGSVMEALDGDDGSVSEQLRKGVHALGDARRLDASLEPVLAGLVGAQDSVDEAVRGASRYLGTLDADPGRLQAVEERLDLLRRLARKHGVTCEALPAAAQALAAQLVELEGRAGRRAELMSRREAVDRDVRAAAAALSVARGAAAATLESDVNRGLASLGMPGAVLKVVMEPGQPLSASGADRVALMFSANPGEPPRPLTRVASGGEASRLFLAMKAALGQSDGALCSVLDEADAGVGGAAADVVGRLIKDIARHRQVLCITHAPQVAAHADTHLRVLKRELAGRTVSQIEVLDEVARHRELARMLSGLTVSPEALSAARVLYRRARRGTLPRSGRPLRAVP